MINISSGADLEILAGGSVFVLNSLKPFGTPFPKTPLATTFILKIDMGNLLKYIIIISFMDLGKRN